MSKVLIKESPPLKFDTSSANIRCFIRGKSDPQIAEVDLSSSAMKAKKRSRADRQKGIEFQDKAFLESVISKILNDADCQGITELIENMVFPGSSQSDMENSKDILCDFMQQEEISQIFRDFQFFNKSNSPHKRNVFHQDQEFYCAIPAVQNIYQGQRQQYASDINSSLINSMLDCPRSEEVNPEITCALSSFLPIAYESNYYAQENCLYQRQFSQRRRKTTGQQVNQYKIIPSDIGLDGRTTLMIRHIPNKYSEEMLFEEIGRNHKMKINFFYLPIDHYNSCNVGYAFVNFVHTSSIQEFYHQFNGRRWDRFNSQKICELAYARIQGTTNLMDHFQGNQLRARTLSQCQAPKSKLYEEVDDAPKGIAKIIDFQKVECS